MLPTRTDVPLIRISMLDVERVKEGLSSDVIWSMAMALESLVVGDDGQVSGGGIPFVQRVTRARS